MLKFHLGILLGIFLVTMLIPNVYGLVISSKDLSQVSLEVLDTQVLYMDDTPGYYLDNADLIKVTVKVTNNEEGYFSVHDKMFRVWAMEVDQLKSTPDNEVLKQVDNYFTIYDDELEVNYDNLQSRELYEECDIINKILKPNVPQIFTVCYEVLRSWTGNAVNLAGPQKYFLVLSDTTQGSSCHRLCHKMPLYNNYASDYLEIPTWVGNLFDWNSKGVIPDSQLQTTLRYLEEKGVLSQPIKEKQSVDAELSLDEKNQMLKEYQAQIAASQSSNLYVSGMTFYETKYFEDFSGVLCKQQNNIVTFSGDFINDDEFYDAIFFKLLLFDVKSNVVGTGLSKVVDVTPGEFRHFEVSSPTKEKFHHCLAVIDSKFLKE